MKGISLVEVLVSMSVLSLVMVASLTLFLPSLGRFAQADTAYDAQRHALSAVTALAADLRESRTSLLTAENAGPGASAFFIPTARTASGAFVLTPSADALTGDMPERQGWIAYYTSDEDQNVVNAPGLFRLHRICTTNRDGALGSGRVVAAGLRSVTVQIGDKASVDALMVANGHIALKVERSGPLSYTPGGRGTLKVEVKTERVLHGHITSAKGEKTIDVPY